MAENNCTCQVCGVGFYRKPSQIKKGGGKFCSKKCEGESRFNKIIRTCLNCGVEFYLAPSKIKGDKGKFCNKKCACISMMGQRFESAKIYIPFCECVFSDLILHDRQRFYRDRIGEIPEGMRVISTCNTPGCVNENHLELELIRKREYLPVSSTGESFDIL